MLLKIYSSLLTFQEEHVFRKVPPGVILTKCGVVASYCVENPFHHTTKSDHVEEDFAIWLLLMLIERKSVFVSNSWVISHGHQWMMKISQMMGFPKIFIIAKFWYLVKIPFPTYRNSITMLMLGSSLPFGCTMPMIR